MSSVLTEELEDLKRKVRLMIPSAELVACYPANVQIKIKKTPYKELLCQFQFPSMYPEVPLLIELKSKTFSPKVLAAMTQLSEVEAKKIIGKPQVVTLVKLLSNFIVENPLLVCSEEISQIKRNFVKEEDEFKVKQKSGVINYFIKAKKYYFHVRLTIPMNYPADCVQITFIGSNFPSILEAHFLGQAKEIARQCVEPPLKVDPKARPFEPKPSLYPVIEYLASLCVHHFPNERCPYCEKYALADNPEDCETDPTAPMFVEWVYCKHVYHHKCLDDYMQTPPFTGGKKCRKCGARIYHEKWNISPRLAEERWAHKEARKRELDDVSEFLDLM